MTSPGLALLLTLPSLLAAQTAPPLGSAAPAFRPGRWVKQGPVALEKGKVTVLEFWATWCGPCRMSIPHLTSLAQRFRGKVRFVGVDIWEKSEGPEDVDRRVDAFVQEMGDQMDYAVCRDTPEGAVAAAWMGARGTHGIPRAYVVDGEGKVVWAGHPMDGLDRVLEAVLAGTHDVNAARKAEEARGQEERLLPDRQPASRCENRWVVLPKNEATGRFPYAFVFIHPQAGFVVRLGGCFALDGKGAFVPDKAESAKVADQMMRLGPEANPTVRLLPEAGRQALGLEARPAWLKEFEDSSEAALRARRRGWLLNHMGEPDLAQAELEPAQKAHPQDVELLFELAYAYNAQEEHAKGLALLKGAMMLHGQNPKLRMELGYTCLRMGQDLEAIQHYTTAHDLMPPDDKLGEHERVTKAELLANLASLYQRTGNASQAKACLDRARTLAPDGHPLRNGQ